MRVRKQTMFSLKFVSAKKDIIESRIFKRFKMGGLLYIIAIILIIAWLIGFVGYSLGGLIHILLVLAIISVLLKLISGRG